MNFKEFQNSRKFGDIRYIVGLDAKTDGLIYMDGYDPFEKLVELHPSNS